MKYSSHHISSIRPVTIDANPDHLADVVFVRFLYCNDALLFFFFSFIFISWRLITSQRFSGFRHTLT